MSKGKRGSGRKKMVKKRNPYVAASRQRHAGPMKDRRQGRGGAGQEEKQIREDWPGAGEP